jgi:hypothetical protein
MGRLTALRPRVSGLTTPVFNEKSLWSGTPVTVACLEIPESSTLAPSTRSRSVRSQDRPSSKQFFRAFGQPISVLEHLFKVLIEADRAS